MLYGIMTRIKRVGGVSRKGKCQGDTVSEQIEIQTKKASFNNDKTELLLP